MGFLKLVSRKTTTIPLEDGDELVVKTAVSKGDYRELLEKLPQDLDGDNPNFTAIEADDFTIGMFNTLVVDWTAVDEDGNKVPATTENYLELPREVSAVIDGKLMEYFNSIAVTEAERKSSAGPRKSNR